MRNKAPDDPPEDIPFWFITYSDVITLLMTFFILLLTFATSEPENFERMQVSLFGGGGAGGIAGETVGPMEKDTVLVRERPRASRMTARGSEMPPLSSDPTYESLKSGVSGLTEEEHRDVAKNYAINMPLAVLVDQDGEVTAQGKQNMHMLALQLKKLQHTVALQVSASEYIPRALKLRSILSNASPFCPEKSALVRGTAPKKETRH